MCGWAGVCSLFGRLGAGRIQIGSKRACPCPYGIVPRPRWRRAIWRPGNVTEGQVGFNSQASLSSTYVAGAGM
ncbi:uncharacterized protein BDZ83DRAFT_344551 [Colletotrichum acutatum]|uniref:Uncharacterized protein n=1 Tax=Glomerella acutata TaxID=27357 RepID=A0AAD8XP24_GLOAC|nr:uncharacterized protein BDZ83DRAFT_344551 [Colletotrichum acutatum]KAK1730909.1 hypothetical protein BDZ83DRAFT_344551 [Colletotrichum acutatum]